MELQICIQNGYTKAEAESLSAPERKAVRLFVAKQNGYQIDWEAGGVPYKPEGEDST